MKLYILLTILIVSLACGAPAYIAPSANTATPYLTSTPEPPVRFVTGCWNVRATPAGTVIDGVCNTALKVYGLEDGWMRIDGGYICPRAFGDEAECETNP